MDWCCPSRPCMVVICYSRLLFFLLNDTTNNLTVVTLHSLWRSQNNCRIGDANTEGCYVSSLKYLIIYWSASCPNFLPTAASKENLWGEWFGFFAGRMPFSLPSQQQQALKKTRFYARINLVARVAQENTAMRRTQVIRTAASLCRSRGRATCSIRHTPSLRCRSRESRPTWRRLVGHTSGNWIQQNMATSWTIESTRWLVLYFVGEMCSVLLFAMGANRFWWKFLTRCRRW